MNYILADLDSTSEYLQEFASTHSEAPAFLFGTLEDIVAASRGDENFHYPCLWLDLPQIATDDNEAANLMEIYSFSITAFFKADLDDKSQRIQAYKKSIKLLQDLQTKLRKDNRSGLIVCGLSGMRKVPLNPTLFNDSHYGYILFFEASFHANDLFF